MREQVLKILYNSKGFISGEEISSKLQVSRTAVWKHINALKLEGYLIESVHKKGYRIIEKSNSLLPVEISNYLTTEKIGENIIHFESIQSTNDYAKENGNSLDHGTIVIAEEQVEGRGRMGRSWVSPKGTGIWMSLVLKPDIAPVEGVKVTQIGAAAVSNALRESLGVDAKIKWPNDITIKGKKVCGILTEMSAEINEIHYLVIGIGINVNVKQFPADIENMATSLMIEKGEPVDRKKILVDILSEFERLYDHFIHKGTLDKTIKICRDHSALIGKNVSIIKSGKKIEEGKVLRLSDDGFIIIKKHSGVEETIQSGEISIRGEAGYV
ncbi:biotin--[acetyl-CoA-carboxylase] ligase [Serpentinicella sp. ANB-PHB4]|uniref:biotin--[acetyl-CoA-carboxylase] ligase n=1 Tax=Serpentinicella sp. ANB-PHB4 TaxID=3074076 RepID=UPI002863140C|nr:biotin--[acetyl-CoA-carboxylase] ligase [Serpentinicella sp. ANB-PHB4]MDR5659114.1 biotin--[acetyl-CoA-carboxylase] ligase [Serpentinicella sp. ANB-PHB4]